MRIAGATVKITDVARAAGVAPMTVSRVLNTPELVSAATALRVREAVARLGYVPNLIAGGLSSRRSRVVAAVVPTIASPMFSDCVQGFTDAMRAHGYQVILSLSGYDTGEDEAVLLRAILGRRPDGLLLTGAQRSPAARRLLADARVPVVEVWDTSPEPTDMLVGFDHEQVGAAVARFFLDRGHDQFAVLAAADPRASGRRRGFVQTVQQAGALLLTARTLPAPSTIADGRAGLAALLPAMPGRTALFCSSDLVAFGAITEARARGVAVPGRLAVCGFGDFELSRTSEPGFTTVSVDGARMAALAAQMLLDRLAGRGGERRIEVPFRIVGRAST